MLVISYKTLPVTSHKYDDAKPADPSDTTGSKTCKGKDHIEVTIPYERDVISVSEQAGLSSSAVAQFLGKKLNLESSETLDLPVRHIWSPSTDFNREVPLIDGGANDNTGVLALLRRGVTKIIASNCLAANIEEEENDLVTSLGGISALFGMTSTKLDRTTDGVTIEKFNAQRHVFPSEDWAPLRKSLFEKISAGKPAVVMVKTKCLRNEIANVPGGHDVELIVVVNHMSADWFNALPLETKREMSEDQEQDFLEKIGKYTGFLKADLHNFPYIPLEQFSYEPRVVNMLTQLMSWEIVESADLIKQLLAGGGEEAEEKKDATPPATTEACNAGDDQEPQVGSA